jgi:hypothetical protein
MHHSKLLDLKVTLVVSLSCLFVGAVSAATIRVPADQPTIQQAIDVANTGDLILVSPGTYFENIDYHGKAISIRSMRGPAQTVIDGSSAGPVVTFQTGEGPTLGALRIHHPARECLLRGRHYTHFRVRHDHPECFPQQRARRGRIWRSDWREWLFASHRA